MTEVATSHAAASPSRDARLQVAVASPAIAARHDKEAWLALYAEGAVVEDPVGTPASHKGRKSGRSGDELGRFYEAFIAPSTIDIRPRVDIVCDQHVFRAVDIHTTNRRTNLVMQIPANLLYTLTSGDGTLQIARMQAHWESSRVGRVLLAQGAKGVATIALMNAHMARAFGFRWVAEYFKTSQEGIGRIGKSVIETLAQQLSPDARSKLFAAGASVELPGGAATSAGHFLEGCTAFRPRDLLASGWTISGLADIEWGGRAHQAGFVAEFDRNAKTIQRLRWFWERSGGL